jgi:hypothetical protein
VLDPNFAYWHSATFSNDGRTVIFTDEWGGGGQPRCRVTDRPEWGANAIFRIGDDRKMTLASYYKLPAAQTDQENCVAHNGSLIPVPGRDIKVQAWYQGGISVFDFTDPANPFEIAYFDRGPMDAERLVSGGYWSAYWYNGHIYGSEMARGLDVFRLRRASTCPRTRSRPPSSCSGMSSIRRTSGASHGRLLSSWRVRTSISSCARTPHATPGRRRSTPSSSAPNG